MRPVDDEQAKRVWSSMELKHVHTDEDVETGPKFDSPTFEDGDEDDLEDLIAAAHHRFEDDIETMSLLSASPPSSPISEQGMPLSPSVSPKRCFSSSPNLSL